MHEAQVAILYLVGEAKTESVCFSVWRVREKNIKIVDFWILARTTAATTSYISLLSLQAKS